MTFQPVSSAASGSRTSDRVRATDPNGFAEPRDMQNALFAELSRMFATEVPLYDKALAVNFETNRAICDLLAAKWSGFSIEDAEIERTSGERHGAIRIGRPDEYRLVTRFFAAFGMEPHGYYDMTTIGAKSQPIIATAFRSTVDPEHRVFSSLLMTDWFDDATRARIESTLAKRDVFGERARTLLDTRDDQGGLDWNDADALIHEGVTRIFKWTGTARDHRLYEDLCTSGFKIAADIACFESHHLNHLTPNTFWINLYAAAMKFRMGEWPEPMFRDRARLAFDRAQAMTDRDWMRLHFKHLSDEQIDALVERPVADATIAGVVDSLVVRLSRPELDLSKLPHGGFKDFTEGPSVDTPILLRQDAYKALTEPVVFHESDGSTIESRHTARFGEIEQRFWATTPMGRALYDECLARAEAAREADPGLAERDFPAFERIYGEPFKPFPKRLRALLEGGFVVGRYEPTRAGIEAAAQDSLPTDVWALVDLGFARAEGLRYEDFLPVSAAGIFASNLSQYGTESTAREQRSYPQSFFEEIVGRPLIDPNAVSAGIEATSLLAMHEALGTWDRLDAAERARIEQAIDACPVCGG